MDSCLFLKKIYKTISLYYSYFYFVPLQTLQHYFVFVLRDCKIISLGITPGVLSSLLIPGKRVCSVPVFTKDMHSGTVPFLIEVCDHGNV
uniref:Uncharacterized protein n=1 Tax=Anguilla anguilla TaxID=7936 RepID=A0A0E9WZQ0_ANGAN